jgi:ribosomal protein L11 methyltransferase
MRAAPPLSGGSHPFIMSILDSSSEWFDPFIEHRGEPRAFWLRKSRPVGETILIARKGFPVPDSRENRKTIFLAAERAFGTGGHGTTEGCLLALEKFQRGGETVLDVGTGTGILAIAAHRLGAGPVTAVDIDAASCREARNNLAANGIATGIEVREGGVEQAEGRFDIIVANLRPLLLVGLMEDLVDKLHDRGVAILSGIMERELHPFLAFLEKYPLELLEMKRIRGWMTLVLRKGGGSRPFAGQRPEPET